MRSVIFAPGMHAATASMSCSTAQAALGRRRGIGKRLARCSTFIRAPSACSMPSALHCCHTRYALCGMSMCVTPRCAKASTTALREARDAAHVRRLRHALGADRMVRRGRHGVVGLPLRRLHRRGQEVVHQAVAEVVAVLVERDLLPHRDREGLGQAAVDLAFDDHRVDARAAVVERVEAAHLGLAGVACRCRPRRRRRRTGRSCSAGRSTRRRPAPSPCRRAGCRCARPCAISFMVFACAGLPLTLKRSTSHSRSPSPTSSRWAAIFCAFARILRAAMRGRGAADRASSASPRCPRRRAPCRCRPPRSGSRRTAGPARSR